MTKLYEYLKKDKALAGDIGIEIEVEGNNLPEISNEVWKSVKDGSLRGESYEYVLAKPVLREKVRPCLEYLNKRLNKSLLLFSFRTSVHVHLNMMECTHDEILNTIYTYLLLEEPLLSYCGKERKGNRFCLRLQDAEGILETLNKVFGGDIRSLRNIKNDSIRYASINLEALTKYGSLEFRALRGTADIQIIDDWVEALYRIRTFAKSKSSPVEIMEYYSSTSPLVFMSSVLGDLSDKFVFPKTEDSIRRSFSLSIDLPFCYKNRKETRAEAVKEEVDRFDPIPADGGVIMAVQFTDVRGNAFKLGDTVKIVDAVPDAEVGWIPDMDEYVGDDYEYEIIDINRLNNGSILLNDLLYWWPPKSLRILRRA